MAAPSTAEHDDSDVIEIVSAEDYNFQRAKLKASVSWILTKAYGKDIPVQLKDPFYDNAKGQLQVRPQLMNLMTSSQLYCQACSNMFPDTASQWQGHWSIIQVLSRKGMHMAEISNTVVTETMLMHTAPFKVAAHLALMDALMKTYASEIAGVETVSQAVHAKGTHTQSVASPGSVEQALVWWINTTCAALLSAQGRDLTTAAARKKLESMSRTRPGNPSSRHAGIADLMADLGDGSCVAATISFYQPHHLSLSDVCLKESMSVADSLYNLRLICTFCNSHLSLKVFHFSYEDLLYGRDRLHENVLVFLAELFFLLEATQTKTALNDSYSEGISRGSVRRSPSPGGRQVIHVGKRGCWRNAGEATTVADSMAGNARSRSGDGLLQNVSMSYDQDLPDHDLNPVTSADLALLDSASPSSSPSSFLQHQEQLLPASLRLLKEKGPPDSKERELEEMSHKQRMAAQSRMVQGKVTLSAGTSRRRVDSAGEGESGLSSSVEEKGGSRLETSMDVSGYSDSSSSSQLHESQTMTGSWPGSGPAGSRLSSRDGTDIVTRVQENDPRSCTSSMVETDWTNRQARSRQDSLTSSRSSGEFSDHESRKIHLDHKARESWKPGGEGRCVDTMQPVSAVTSSSSSSLNNRLVENPNLPRHSDTARSDHGYNHAAHSSFESQNAARNTPIQNAARTTPVQDLTSNTQVPNASQSTSVQSAGGNTPVQNTTHTTAAQNYPHHSEHQDTTTGLKSAFLQKSDGGGKKATFAPLPTETTWQERAQRGSSQTTLSRPNDLLTNGDRPAMSELSQLRMKLEEKRREIERKKQVQEVHNAKMRQRLGKAAFMRVIAKKDESGCTVGALTSRPVFSAWTGEGRGNGISGSTTNTSPSLTHSLLQERLGQLGSEEVTRPTTLLTSPPSSSNSTSASQSPSNTGRTFSREGIQQTIDSVRRRWFHGSDPEGEIIHSQDDTDSAGGDPVCEMTFDMMQSCPPCMASTVFGYSSEAESPSGERESEVSVTGTSLTEASVTGTCPARSRESSQSPGRLSEKRVSWAGGKSDKEDYDRSLDKLNKNLTDLQGEINRLTLQQHDLFPEVTSEESASQPGPLSAHQHVHVASQHAQGSAQCAQGLIHHQNPPLPSQHSQQPQSSPHSQLSSHHPHPQSQQSGHQLAQPLLTQHTKPSTHPSSAPQSAASSSSTQQIKHNIHTSLDPSPHPHSSNSIPEVKDTVCEENSDLSKEDGFFVSFGEDTPRRRKPQLGKNRDSGGKKSPFRDVSERTTPVVNTIPGHVENERGSPFLRKTVPFVDRDSSRSSSSDSFHSLPGASADMALDDDDDVSAPHNSLETERQKKRERLLQQQQKRQEDIERKRRKKEEETLRQQQQKILREEEKEKKKAEEKARKEAIFRQYLQKKLEQEEEKSSSSSSSHRRDLSTSPSKRDHSVNRRDTSSNRRDHSSNRQRTRPKSMFAKARPLPSDLEDSGPGSRGMSSHSSQEDLSSHSSPIGSTVSCHQLGQNGEAGSHASRRPPSPGTKLYVKPSAKSNRHIIINALSYCCLAGIVNTGLKNKVLQEIAKSTAKHFLILFRDHGCQYRGLFSFDPDTEEGSKLLGMGPRQLSSEMVERFYKYNSGGKTFTEVTSTKHLSVSIDAVVLKNSYWKSKVNPAARW